MRLEIGRTSSSIYNEPQMYNLNSLISLNISILTFKRSRYDDKQHNTQVDTGAEVVELRRLLYAKSERHCEHIILLLLT